MSEPVVLRPRFGIVLCFIVWAIVVVCVVSLIATGDALTALRFTPAFLLAAWLCWMLFWAPAVAIDPSGVSLINVMRTVRVTWPAIAAVETKYTLTLRTVARKKFGAWAAPGPSRFGVFRATRADLANLPETSYGPGNSVGMGDIPTSDSGLAALRVRRYWEELRAAGHLDAAPLERDGVFITWHSREIIVLAVLVTATVVGVLL